MGDPQVGFFRVDMVGNLKPEKITASRTMHEVDTFGGAFGHNNKDHDFSVQLPSKPPVYITPDDARMLLDALQSAANFDTSGQRNTITVFDEQGKPQPLDTNAVKDSLIRWLK